MQKCWTLKDRANFDLGNFEVIVLKASKTATKLLDNTVLNVPINIAKIHCVENVRIARRVKKIKSVFQVVTLRLHVASSVLSDKRPARYLLIKEGMMSDIFQGKNTA